MPLMPYSPALVYIIGSLGGLGLTAILSAASDLLAIVTFHLYIIYLLATLIFSWHMEVIYSLFNVFRGELNLPTKPLPWPPA
jgi:hypothetical protein